jgi:hypothetical protein
MQIGEQLGEFKDRVNAVQQMTSYGIVNPGWNGNYASVNLTKGFNALATKLSDYYQIEPTYVWNDGKDIIIILHVPGTKEIDWLTIYRYFPSYLIQIILYFHLLFKLPLSNAPMDFQQEFIFNIQPKSMFQRVVQ